MMCNNRPVLCDGETEPKSGNSNPSSCASSASISPVPTTACEGCKPWLCKDWAAAESRRETRPPARALANFRFMFRYQGHASHNQSSQQTVDQAHRATVANPAGTPHAPTDYPNTNSHSSVWSKNSGKRGSNAEPPVKIIFSIRFPLPLACCWYNVKEYLISSRIGFTSTVKIGER